MTLSVDSVCSEMAVSEKDELPESRNAAIKHDQKIKFFLKTDIWNSC